MIAAALFPVPGTVLSGVFQDRGARMHLPIGQRRPRHGARARRDLRAGLAVEDRVMVGAGIVSAIGRDHRERFGGIALREQIRQHLAIADEGVGQLGADHLVRAGVDRQLQLAPPEVNVIL